MSVTMCFVIPQTTTKSDINNFTSNNDVMYMNKHGKWLNSQLSQDLWHLETQNCTLCHTEVGENHIYVRLEGSLTKS